MNEEELNLLLEELMPLIKERQYAQLYQRVRDLKPADIALLFEEVPMEDVILLFRLLPKDTAAETFVELEPDRQQKLIGAFSDAELKAVLDELYLDDTVDIIEEMPANVVRRIVQYSSPEMRQSINEILNFPADSAGSIMTIEYVDLDAAMTVDNAFEHIRETGWDKETIYTCYVIGTDRRLQGVVTVQQLLLCERCSTIGDIMDRNVISCKTTDNKVDVAQTLNKYDFLALPVVDNEERLVGIVTIDDAIDVLTDDATEDMEKMAAILPSEKTYLRTGVFETWKQRIPWLLLLMLSSTFTQKIINSAEDALSACVALTAFIPMLMGTGGNAGGQASVTVIRGLSLDEIGFSDWLRVFWKEFRVALFCGITLTVANFAKLLIFDHVTMTVAVVVCITLLVVVIFAKIVGCLLPIAAKRIGFDPAVMASPFITTIVDALALLTYFQVAKMLLHI
ncbi:MAG: magnesium transporter [Clostridia bacterium]|nr:magnesium transporter [Clostridia bacterium]